MTEKWVDGPERLTTGAGQETNLAISADGTRLIFTATSSTTRLWAFPFDAARGRVTGQPYPITQGNTGEVDFDVRADGLKIAYHTVRAGRNELWERSTIEGQERLLLSSTDSRLAKPLWSPDGARLAFLRCATRDKTVAVAVLNTDGSGDRVLTLPGDVEMQGSDWSKDGQAILGACRFNRSDRYSTCLVPVSSANEIWRFACPGHRVGFKAQSLQSAVLPRSALDHLSRARPLVRLDVHRLRHTDGRWCLAGDDRRRVV